MWGAVEQSQHHLYHLLPTELPVRNSSDTRNSSRPRSSAKT